MPKPIISIDSFSAGILSDETIPATNGFNFSAGIDLAREPGILQVNQALTAMDLDSSITAVWDMKKYSGDSKVYATMGTQLWNYDGTVAAKWGAVTGHDSTSDQGELCDFGGTLYWSSRTGINETNGTVFRNGFLAFTAQDTKWHPKVVYLGKMMVGDGRYIFTLDADGVANATALTLPQGYRIRCLEVYGDRLVIGTWRGTNIYDFNEATLFTWNGTDALPTQEWTISESNIHAFFPWRNILIVFAGTQGNIYAFNGVTLTKLTQLPYKTVFNNISAWGYVNPKAVVGFRGNLIFGWSHGVGDYSGLFSLEYQQTEGNFSLNSPLIIPHLATDNTAFSAMYSDGKNVLYVQWYDATPGTYGIAQLDTSNRISSGAYLDTQIYEIPKDSQARALQGVEIIARPMASVASIWTTIQYKLDNAPSWSDLGKIGWLALETSNQDDIYRGINQRAKTVQLRIQFQCSTKNSPEISAIKIY